MNRKSFLIYMIILGITFPVLAQQNNDFLPNINPPSPTAYELGKYGEVPVGMFTGTPAVDIPLSTYKSKNIEIPISLSYRSNGIKVDQLSSNTGLGWSLNAGGVITRMVRDEEDGNRLSLSYPKGEPRGTKGLNSPLVREYFFNANGYEVDSEPDLYMYNFVGYTGSFVFDDDGKIIMNPVKDLIIEPSEIGFKITDSKGYQYIFQDVELTFNRSSGGGHVPPGFPNETAWYLSKIIDTKNGHEVNFHYSNQNYSYTLSKTDQLKVANPVIQNNCPGESLTSGVGHHVLPEITNTLTVAGKKLDSISSTGGEKIIFAYDTDHPAVLGYKLATTINMINENDKLIQLFSLKYLKTNNKRVFLETISFLNPNKKYTFEYYDPEGLAPRLSKAQDHWGYFNGKLNNRYWFPNPNSINNIHLSFNTINIGADKSIHSISAEKGLLRKIIYPSKGYTEFKYEQNSYWDKITIPPPKSHLALNVYSDELFENEKRQHVVHLNDILMNQKAEFFINVSFNTNACSEDLLKSTAYVKLTDKTTGKNIRFFGETHFETVNINIFRHDSEIKKFYAYLEEGHSYELELKATYFCTRAEMEVTYTDKPLNVQHTNISSGGKRVKSVLSKVSSNAIPELTTYYYGKKESPQKSSGVKGIRPYYYSHTTYRKSCSNQEFSGSQFNCSYVDVKHILLNSSSLRKLFNSDLFTNYYKYVTISKGGANFELGGEENEFIVHNDYPGNPLLGNSIQYAPLVNAGWSNGLLKRKLVFKKNELDSFTNLSETHHSYKLDSRFSTKAYGYSIRKKFDLICYYTNRNLENLDILEYTINSYWFYRDSTIQKAFDSNGNNPIETVTNYFYDNSKHKQLTKTETTTSNGKTITKKLYYPDDVISTTSLPGGPLSSSEFNAIKRLKTPTDANPDAQHRIGEVVQEVTEISGSDRAFSKRNNYADWTGKILPKSVQTSKSTQPLEDRVVYHRYDSHANPLEISQKDGPHTVYLYGYTQQYPIAKIENVTFSEVAMALGVSASALEDFNESNLSQVNTLRAQKPKWMITTYTHIPLVGMETVTDPKGLTTTYEYDDFNRLQYIIDHNGDILEAYEYNYRTE